MTHCSGHKKVAIVKFKKKWKKIVIGRVSTVHATDLKKISRQRIFSPVSKASSSSEPVPKSDDNPSFTGHTRREKAKQLVDRLEN